MSFFPYYEKHSDYQCTDPLISLIKQQNLTDLKIWKPFHSSLPNFNFTKIPKQLENIERIPMEDLIHKLKNLQSIEEESFLPNWSYSIIYCSIAIIVGICLFCVCKYRNRIRCKGSAKNKREMGLVTLPNYNQMASTKVESDVTAPRDKPSAPLLEETQNQMYPVLNLTTVERK